MTEDGEREEAERAAGQEPRRPRVVDKRVSSRTAQEPPAPAPEASGPAPAPEPEAPERTRTEEPPPGDAPQAPEGERVWTPEQEAEAQRLLEAMTQTPALDWILNSAVTLANVAGVKLDAGDLPGAQMAIDALAALVNGLGDRLGQAEQPLRQSLSQLQMAYAQTATTPPGQKKPR